MLTNILFVFDLIYKLFKLQFCIVLSLIVGLFIFSVGPTLYSTSAIVNEVISKESTSVVRAYFKYFFQSIKETTLVGILYTIFIICSILFAYNLRIFFSGSLLAILSNFYYFLVLVACISLYIFVSIVRTYNLTRRNAFKQTFKIITKVPFVPLFIVLWSIGSTIIFSTFFGLYVVMGLAIYLGGIFLIINMFIKENEEALNYETNKS